MPHDQGPLLLLPMPVCLCCHTPDAGVGVQMPRQIPEVPFYRSGVAQVMLAGFLPFSAISIELHYIFASIWGHKVYTLFGILFLAFVLCSVVTSFIVIALTYFQLAVEDHRWCVYNELHLPFDAQLSLVCVLSPRAGGGGLSSVAALSACSCLRTASSTITTTPRCLASCRCVDFRFN